MQENGEHGKKYRAERIEPSTVKQNPLRGC